MMAAICGDGQLGTQVQQTSVADKCSRQVQQTSVSDQWKKKAGNQWEEVT